MRLAIASICIFIFFSTSVSSQNTIDTTFDSTIDSLVNDSVLVMDTSIFYPGSTFLDYTKADDPRNFELSLVQNPTKALLKSMLVPGWGQYKNKRKFKAVLFFGLDVWFVSSAFKYKSQTTDFSNQYNAADETDIVLRNELYSKFLNRKDQRNKYTWLAVITTFISMFDAFTDAHLSGFPKKEMLENLSVGYDLNENDNLKISLSYQF